MSYDLTKFPAGLQLIESGNIQIGDVLKFSHALPHHAYNGYIGSNISNFGGRVYRPMPVAKPGDCDGPAKAEAMASEMQQLADGGKAKTYDGGKPPLAQLPWAAMRELSMVQLYGYSKYQDFNNYRQGMEISRNLSCAIRHISEFMDGHDNDVESGRSHLGHALCRIAFVLQNMADGVAVDDRFKR